MAVLRAGRGGWPCVAQCRARAPGLPVFPTNWGGGLWPTVGAAHHGRLLGSAANLNIHLHCLVLDGVYRCDADGVPAFVEAATSTDDNLHGLLQFVIARLMKMLTREGVLV